MKIRHKAYEALMGDWGDLKFPCDVLERCYGLDRNGAAVLAFPDGQGQSPVTILMKMDIYAMGRTHDEVREKIKTMEVV